MEEATTTLTTMPGTAQTGPNDDGRRFELWVCFFKILFVFLSNFLISF
jgi:hypothetical protein